MEKDNSSNQIDFLISKLLDTKNSKNGYINFVEDEIKTLCDKSIKVFMKEEALLELSPPLFICGDIHGQYYDMMRMFQCCGLPPSSRFLFLGDYVDRGKQGLETICLLLALKVKHPDHIFLLRGNHESASVCRIYGFFDECKKRISVKSWKMFCDVFVHMPIVAMIDKKILCMHGGLSPELEEISQLKRILKPTEIPDEGLLCDLVWSDPTEEKVVNFGYNERGISVTFTKEWLETFLIRNELDLVVRAHQVVEEGYEFFGEQTLVTIFTAPNYLGEFNNNGAIMTIDKNLMCSFQILKPDSKVKKKINKLSFKSKT